MTSRTRGWMRAIATLLGWLAASATAFACPICFQSEPNSATDGVRAAVLVLIGVTVVVLGGFARFAVRFTGRAMGSRLELTGGRGERAPRSPAHLSIQDATPPRVSSGGDA